MTVFQYAGSQVLREKQGANYTATYTYGNALIRKDSEVPLFDGLGSERTAMDGSQNVTGTLTTEGFGQTVATTGSSSSSCMFAATSGYRNDGDAGLMHVGARYYDAQVGRFVSRDTYLDQKPYLYREHNPVNAVDPSGHSKSVPTLIQDAGVTIGVVGGVGAVVGLIPGIGELGPPLVTMGSGLVAVGGLIWVVGRAIEYGDDPDYGPPIRRTVGGIGNAIGRIAGGIVRGIGDGARSVARDLLPILRSAMDHGMLFRW